MTAKSRSELLADALHDARVWCYNPDDGPRLNTSDQYWLAAFANPESVTPEVAQDFLKTFQLDNQKYPWDAAGVATTMRSYISKVGLDVPVDLAELAKDLGASLQTPASNRTKQVSAASKFLFFAKPGVEIFIWDKWATKAIRERSPARIHGYADFLKASSTAFAAECRTNQFKDAVADLVSWIDAKGGPMADRNLASEQFIARRLFDKWMFFEGKNAA